MDNIWIYAMNILLAGWLIRKKFNLQAKPLKEGPRLFQYDKTHTKNLCIPIHDLKPVSVLLERVGEWSR